jgi:hypothetical protein
LFVSYMCRTGFCLALYVFLCCLFY